MRICFLICRYCPFICPTIAQNTFYVQLVVRNNFNRLNRKYEGFVYCFGFGVYFVPIWWLNVKNLELFQDLFGGMV